VRSAVRQPQRSVDNIAANQPLAHRGKQHPRNRCAADICNSVTSFKKCPKKISVVWQKSTLLQARCKESVLRELH